MNYTEKRIELLSQNTVTLEKVITVYNNAKHVDFVVKDQIREYIGVFGKLEDAVIKVDALLDRP